MITITWASGKDQILASAPVRRHAGLSAFAELVDILRNVTHQ